MKKQMARRIATALLSGAIAFSSAVPVMAETTTKSKDNVSYESIDAYKMVGENDNKVDATQWDGSNDRLQYVYDANGKKTATKRAAQIESYFTKLGETHTYTVSVWSKNTNDQYGGGGANGWRFVVDDPKGNGTTDTTVNPNPGQGWSAIGAITDSSLNDDAQKNLDGSETDPGKANDAQNFEFTDSQDDGLEYKLVFKWFITDVEPGFTVTFADGRNTAETDATGTWSTDDKKTFIADEVQSISGLTVTSQKFGTYKFKMSVIPYWKEVGGEGKEVRALSNGKTVEGYTGAYVSMPLSKSALKDLLSDTSYSPANADDAETFINTKLDSTDLLTSANEKVNLSVYGDVSLSSTTEDNKNLTKAETLLKVSGEKYYIALKDNTKNNEADPNKNNNTPAQMNDTDDDDTKDYSLRFAATKAETKFDDVSDSSYYAAAVKWASEKGYISGYPNGNFGSLDPVTREQFAQILYNYAGKTKSTKTVKAFADEDKIDSWAKEAVDWAHAEGFIDGDPDGNFNPTKNIARQDLVQILYNYSTIKNLSLKDSDTYDNEFSDVDPLKYYAEAVDWAGRKGVASGRPNGSFGIGDDVNRADAVVMLNNLDGQIVK